MSHFRSQAALTRDDEIRRPLMEITSQPKDFDGISPAERHSWVCSELASGRYVRSDEISIATLLTNGSQADYRNADHIMYQVLLSEVDPALAAEKVLGSSHARFFLESYGLETSAEFLDDHLWFSAYMKTHMANEDTTQQIKSILQRRGAERIAEVVNASRGIAYLEIFGIEAIKHLPKRISDQVRGKYLEESLGL
jgi:hypothetical protein